MPGFYSRLFPLWGARLRHSSLWLWIRKMQAVRFREGRSAFSVGPLAIFLVSLDGLATQGIQSDQALPAGGHGRRSDGVAEFGDGRDPIVEGSESHVCSVLPTSRAASAVARLLVINSTVDSVGGCGSFSVPSCCSS